MARTYTAIRHPTVHHAQHGAALRQRVADRTERYVRVIRDVQRLALATSMLYCEERSCDQVATLIPIRGLNEVEWPAFCRRHYDSGRLAS